MGLIISYEEYTPYGSTAYQAVNKDIKAAAKRYRYTGMERDEETGLSYHGARYYAGWLGRWVSCDPIGVQDGLNLYQYCRDNPVNRTDRMGSDSWSWNPLNFFSDDYTFNPGEYTYKVARGIVTAGIGTGIDTAFRVADMTTQGTSAFGKWTGWYDIGYTELSPEARRYDPTLSYRRNIQKTGSETKEGIKAFGKRLSDKDPDAVGTLVFIVATSVGGKPPSLPNIPFFSVPRLATSVTTTGVRATQFVWESTAISSSTIQKFGGLILAVAATSSSSSDTPSGGGKPASRQYPSSTGQVASSRGVFMDRALRTILKDPNHPLRFLINPKTKNWWARSHLSQEPTVQAGHLTSRHSGAAERYGLEDSAYNQWSSNKGETQGAIFKKPAVDIGGVSVEGRTAQQWQRMGKIP